MSRSSHNLAVKETHENAHEGAKTPLSGTDGINTAKRAQNVQKALSVVPAKRIADRVEVGARMVQKWAAGEVKTPSKHFDEIQKEAVEYFLDLETIHQATVRDLLMAFVPRHGHASRGAF